jgi:LysM repeat protein
MYSGLDVSGTAPVGLYQDSKITYDELGRMGHIADVSYDIQYEYDAVGNRRAVRATYLDPLWNDVRRREDFWYTYDGANRFTLTKGTLEGGRRGTSLTDGTARIVQGAFGVALTYNGVGRRTSARYADNSFEEYFYSTDGFLEDTYITPDGGARKLRARRRVDSVGRTLQYKEYDTAGVLAKTTDSVYDLDNRMLSQKNAEGTTNYFYFINTNDIVGSATAAGSGALAKTVFTPVGTSPTSITTTYSYQYWDGAKQTAIMKKADNESVASWAPGTSDMRYNVNGFLISARDNTGGRQFSYFNNASGQVLRRDERNEYSPSTASDDVTFVHYWYYANGRRVGEVTTDPNDNQRISYAESLAISLASPKKEADNNKHVKPVTSADFDQNYEPIGPNYPASTPSPYIARSGDTLRSVAQALWGDGDMWYLLAQTNNLQGDEQLVAGQVLIVPNKVTNIHNNANTFRPYNPGEVIGHIDPTLPQPPQQNNSSGCGGLGIVLMIVVAIAVTVATAGAMAGVMGVQLATAAGGTVAASSMGVMAAGTAVLTGAGGLTAAALGAAAVGAAAGSIASQLVGMAAGVVDDFSWKAVAQSALGAGITAGVGSMIGTVGSQASTGVTTASNSANATSIADTVGQWISTAGRAALAGGLSTAATQAIQGKWSWRDIAANAVGSAAGSVAGSAVGEALKGYEAAAFASRMASSFAGAAAADQVRATDPNYTRASTSSMFVSSIGNAIGATLVDAITPNDRNVSDSSYRNEMDRDSDNATAAREWQESYFHRNGADMDSDIAAVGRRRRDALYGLASSGLLRPSNSQGRQRLMSQDLFGRS